MFHMQSISRCRKIVINMSAGQIARIESVNIGLNDTVVRQPLQNGIMRAFDDRVWIDVIRRRYVN